MATSLGLIFGRTAKNSYVTIGANLIYGLLTMTFFIVASRVLGPANFGLVSIALALFAISFDVLSLGTSQALVRSVSIALGQHQNHRAIRLAAAIFKLRLVEAVLLVAASVIFGRVIAVNVYHQTSLITPITLTLAFASGILLVDFFISLLQAYERFVAAALITLTIAALKLMILFLLTWFNRASVTLVTAAFVITPALSSLLGLWLFPQKLISLTIPKSVFIELWQFSKWMALWGITASLFGRIDILLLGKLTSAYETGIYSVASRLASGFILIGSAFASVLTPKISRVIHDSVELKRQLKLIYKPVAAITLLIIVVAALSRWLILLLFGPQYIAATLIFQTLSLSLIFFTGSIPANVSLLALGHSRFIGVVSSLQLAIVLTLGWLMTPALGAQGVAIALAAAYLASFGLSTTYAFNKIFTKAA